MWLALFEVAVRFDQAFLEGLVRFVAWVALHRSFYFILRRILEVVLAPQMHA